MGKGIVGWFQRVREKETRRWWEGLDFTQIGDWSPGIFQAAVLSYTDGDLPTIYRRTWKGFLSCTKEEFVQIMEAFNAHPLFADQFRPERGAMFVWEDAIININYDKDHSYSAFMMSKRPEFIEEVRSAFKRYEVAAPVKGLAYVITTSPAGFVAHNLGRIKGELIPDNYPKHIVSQYERLLREITTPEPSGRLTLLSGPPGTGKSHFIRGMMAAADATFLLVPPNFVGRLGGPEMIMLLEGVREKNLPIVIVLEDADAALVRREKGSMSVISDLLNLADGIVGEMLNIRIVATTNASELDMDKAVLRRGRLSQQIKFELLDKDYANGLVEKISAGAKKGTFNKDVPLADVYYEAQVDDKADKADSKVVNTKRQRYGTYL